MTTLSADLRTLSYEAYLYSYPLVIMDVTRRQSLNGTTAMSAPPNVFNHLREYPSADFRSVVRPNFDTLYSSAWLDLTAGPVKLSVPDTDDRYFMLPMLDMWTDVFANPGKRTSGTAAQEYLIVGPGYSGPLPPDAEVITAPTPHVWIIGRTQTNGPSDYPAVHRVQDGYLLTPSVPATEPLVRDENYDVTTEPMHLVSGMAALDYLGYAADLLAVNPPHQTDYSILARLSNLGIEVGKPFDAQRFSADQQDEIEAGRRDALATISSAAPTMGTITNGWMTLNEGMGVYGNGYLRRAVIALIGLGANPPEDAVYPILLADADGAPLSGENDYVLHFDADALPPVDAFWSVTMYDAQGYQSANELNRFAIGDRDDLTFNPDGSLDLFLQHGNPGAEKVANWLPAPLGALGVTMRLYAPRREILDGKWHPPAIRRI